MVISIPSYYTEIEKKSLLDSFKICEIDVVKLQSENSAICLSYGMLKNNEFSQKIQ